MALHLRQGDAALTLVFAAAVFVARFADVVRFEEDDLGDAFVGVDLCGEWGGVGELERDVAFPFRFEGRHVHQNSAARVRALAQTDGQNVARDAEVLDGAREGEAVRWNDYRIAFDVDKVLLVEFLWIHDGAVDVSEEFELVGAANVVTIT